MLGLPLIVSQLEHFRKHRRYNFINKPVKVKQEAGKQLKEKDEQIKAQAIHIQTLLNQKQIEAPGGKCP
jgi:hypothetical protein